MNNLFHPLERTHALPSRFTYPFCYTPHPLCLAAAVAVQRYVDNCGVLAAEPGGGKMFGVLVVTDEAGQLGFLAAYSGLLAHRNDWPYFVPPVFDAQQPGGYFKMREAQISALGRDIDAMEHDSTYIVTRDNRDALAAEAQRAIDDYRRQMAEAKQRRDLRRLSPLTPDEEEAMKDESRYMKAQLRRIRKEFSARLDVLDRRIAEHDEKIRMLRERRRSMSDGLQEWLFRRYEMLDAHGHRANLLSIFAHTPQGVPPAGTGDCCAPKLLQYAFLHRLRPVCMAEFWWGLPPRNELRRHGHFYPACSGKCKPLLGYMLRGMDVDPDPLASAMDVDLEVIYEDDSIIVVDKPSGMLSVPGKNSCPSVVSLLQSRMDDGAVPMAAHRLDMDTSGLMVVAKSAAACHALQRQFASRRVTKRYVALLDGVPSVPREGIISLPMRPDPLDRPRQMVDHIDGREARTRYELVSSRDGRARLNLYPLTGRTHQLRVHCAHPDGLSCPILGDNLYGRPAERLFLHAAEISFTHPVTGAMMRFESRPEF